MSYKFIALKLEISSLKNAKPDKSYFRLTYNYFCIRDVVLRFYRFFKALVNLNPKDRSVPHDTQYICKIRTSLYNEDTHEYTIDFIHFFTPSLV